MPIPLSCACGKELRLKDELAGKRIKCPACQEILTVPQGDDEPVAAVEVPAPVAVPIALACACGKEFKVKAELAGKKIKCPACKGIVSVPAPQGTEEPLLAPEHEEAAAEESAPPPSQRKPMRKHKADAVLRDAKRKQSIGLAVAAAGSVLLLALPVGWLVTRDRSPRPAVAEVAATQPTVQPRSTEDVAPPPPPVLTSPPPVVVAEPPAKPPPPVPVPVEPPVNPPAAGDIPVGKPTGEITFKPGEIKYLDIETKMLNRPPGYVGPLVITVQGLPPEVHLDAFIIDPPNGVEQRWRSNLNRFSLLVGQNTLRVRLSATKLPFLAWRGRVAALVTTEFIPQRGNIPLQQFDFILVLDGKPVAVAAEPRDRLAGPMLPPLPGAWDNRTDPAARDKLVKQYGGTPRSETAVADGLKWLVRHQALDGHWDFSECAQHGKCNCGNAAQKGDATGLVLLAFLGVGETHKSTGKQFLYAKPVERGLKWLLTKQTKDGAFPGNVVAHAQATMAVCEAYGMTGDPTLRAPAQAAVNRCVLHQALNGGFSWTPGEKKSYWEVARWYMPVFRTAQCAGLDVPQRTVDAINTFLDGDENADGSYKSFEGGNANDYDTGFCLLARLLCGWERKNPKLALGIPFLEKTPPNPARMSSVHWYCANQVMFYHGGKPWNDWNGLMRDLVLTAQDQGQQAEHKCQKGSFSWAKDGDGHLLGRLGHTALRC